MGTALVGILWTNGFRGGFFAAEDSLDPTDDSAGLFWRFAADRLAWRLPARALRVRVAARAFRASVSSGALGVSFAPALRLRAEAWPGFPAILARRTGREVRRPFGRPVLPARRRAFGLGWRQDVQLRLCFLLGRFHCWRRLRQLRGGGFRSRDRRRSGFLGLCRDFLRFRRLERILILADWRYHLDGCRLVGRLARSGWRRCGAQDSFPAG
jgi:hypothetical protein